MQVMIQSDPGRRERRWRVKHDVAIDVPDAGVPRNQVVTVRNLSENGLLVESTAPLPVGSTFSFTLADAGETSAEVVWQKGSLHGCRFHVPLPKSAVNAAVLRSPIGPHLLERKEPGLALNETEEFMKREPPISLSVPTIVALVLFVAGAIVMIVLS